MSYRVGIIARNVKQGGVARFLRELLYALDAELVAHQSDASPRAARESTDWVVITPEPESFADLKFIQVVGLPAAPLFWWDEWVSYRYLRKHPCDALIYPKTTVPWTHQTLRATVATIVHDLGYYASSPHLYPWLERCHMKLRLPGSFRRASQIWAVSEFTRSEIGRLFPRVLNRVEVLGEGIAPSFETDADTPIANLALSPGSYFFYSGDTSPRKNLDRLLRGYRAYRHQLPPSTEPLQLIITGIKTNPKKWLQQWRADGMEGVTITGHLPHAKLLWCYRNARALVYPSLYEGFGLPLVEAQISRCAVLASEIAICRETTGGFAQFFNPWDPHSIADALTNATLNPADNALLELGHEHARRQSWSQPAAKWLQWAQEKAGRTNS